MFITFFGGDSGAGTTLMAAAFARLMEAKGLRVLLLCASEEADEGWFPAKGKGLEGLLRSTEPSEAELLFAVNKGKPDYLAGPENLLNRQFYDPGLIKHIMSFARKHYDLLVADGGCDGTLPLPAACLAWADRRIYVSTGNAKSVKRFADTYGSIVKGLGMDTSSDILVVNKASSAGGLASAARLMEALDLRGFVMPLASDGLMWELEPETAFSGEPQLSILSQIGDEALKKVGGSHAS